MKSTDIAVLAALLVGTVSLLSAPTHAANSKAIAGEAKDKDKDKDKAEYKKGLDWDVIEDAENERFKVCHDFPRHGGPWHDGGYDDDRFRASDERHGPNERSGGPHDPDDDRDWDDGHGPKKCRGLSP